MSFCGKPVTNPGDGAACLRKAGHKKECISVPPQALAADKEAARPYYGSMVDPKTRELLYLAPTTYDKGDPHSNNGGGCLRKWFYRYVLKWKAEEKAFQTLGKECHAEVEHYMLTGENVLGRITMAAKRYIPLPDIERKRLLIEYDIGMGSLEKAPLRAAGVPFIGYTDLVHAEPAINEDGDGFFDDPPGTIEVLDWKFGKTKKGAKRGDYSKSGPELTVDTQMVTYGEAFSRLAHRTPETARLSHVYTNTSGRPESSKASVLVDRSHLAKRWEYIEAGVRTLKDIARETDPERVPGNIAACDSYGGCPYREQCSASDQLTLIDCFGETGAETLSRSLNMGLTDSLNLGALGVPSAPAAPASPTPVASPAGVGVALDIMSQMAALGAPAPTAPAWQPTQPTREFADAVTVINSKGYGFPTLTGRAAQMFGVLNRHANVTPTYEVAGFGRLFSTPSVEDPARVISIGQELAPVPANPTPDQRPAPTAPAPIIMGIVAPDAPASNPALAALPVEGFASPAAVTPGVGVPGLIASVPAATAAQILATNAPATPPAGIPEAPAEKPKTGKGSRGPRKPKSSGEAPTVTGHLESGEPIEAKEGLWLFVNALPNIEYVSLQAHVDALVVRMAVHYKCDPIDVRCGAKDGPLGYGAFEGGITAAARKLAESLEAGAYYLDLRASKFNEAFVQGLREARRINTDGTIGELVFELVVRGHSY